MSGTTSTSPISMRAAASSNNNNQKKQRGLFKGWKKNTNKSSSAGGNNSNQIMMENQRHQSPNRSYNNPTSAAQFSPAIHHSHQRRITNVSSFQKLPPSQKLQQNYATNNDEYYHYCNDELSRQLQLAAQKDRQLNEERRMTKRMFRERHCAPHATATNNKNSKNSGQSSPTQMQLQQKWHHLQQQQQQQQQNGSMNKSSDLQTQSTQATRDTASSSTVSHTSSLTNNTTSGNNNNGGRKVVTPVTNALSTAAQVFHQEQSGRILNPTTAAVTAANGGGEEEYVKEWTPLSNSFLEQSIASGDEFDWNSIDHHDNNEEEAAAPAPPQATTSSTVWKEAIDPKSNKMYYYNIRTKEVSWTIPQENEGDGRRRSKTPPPPPPPLRSNNSSSSGNVVDTIEMQLVKTPHRSNTSGVQRQQQRQQKDQRKKKQQQQQQKRKVHKSPPRARASPSLDSIAEDDDDDYYNDDDDDGGALQNDGGDEEDENSEDAVNPTQQQQQQSRTRSKSPFRVISRSRSPVVVLRHASSSFHSDPNRGGDPNGVGGGGANSDDGGGGERRRSISPFRVFNKHKSKSSKKKNKGKKKNPVVNMPPSLRRGKGGGEVGDVVSLVSYYDDPSIGALSSLDDTTTLASRSLSKRSSSVIAVPSSDDVGVDGSAGGGSGERRDAGSGSGSGSDSRRDASRTPPRHKKHADPPGNSIDEIFHQKQNQDYSQYSSRDSRSPYRRERQQQQRRLPDPSPMRPQQQQQQQQQHAQHSPYRQHQSSYSRQSPQKQQYQQSPYKHQQQQQQQDPPYMEKEQEHRSPYSGQHQHDPPYMEETQQERSPYSEQQHQQYLQQPQIFVDEDGNQWMVTPQEVPRQSSLQPRNAQQPAPNNHRQQPQQQQPRPRKIYYDEEGQPYYYEDDDDDDDDLEEQYDPEQQQYQQQSQQHQEHSMPPPDLQTPRQGWQWSEQKEPTHADQYPDQGDYPAEEYFEDGNGNFISFITPNSEEGDNHVLGDFESIGMLTGDEEGLQLEEHNGTADDDTTAANTLNTVDLVAEVKRVWRHVQRYEQKKSMTSNNNRIEKKDSEEELLVHQFTQAFVQASPGRANKSSATSMNRSNAGASVTKSSKAGVSTVAPPSIQGSTSDAAQISPEKEVVSSNGRGRSHSKDSRLGEHLRSTSVHSRALSSRAESPAIGSDYAMMSHGDTEMDGAFISEGMDAFFLSPGKEQTSTLKQQAQQKQHLLHPAQVAAAQKLMQNKKAAISASSATKSSSAPAPTGAQQQDLTSPYDFNKVKSTGTNFSQKTQTISNTTNSSAAIKAHNLEKARKQQELTNRSRSPPRPRNSRNVNSVQTQQREEERKEAVSPGRLYKMALKSAKDRQSQRE